MRELTTQQIAEAYGADAKVLSNNFNRNKDRYVEGKHFICLEGKDKRQFINHHQIDDGSKNANKFYLWTEKGALQSPLTQTKHGKYMTDWWTRILRSRSL